MDLNLMPSTGRLLEIVDQRSYRRLTFEKVTLFVHDRVRESYVDWDWRSDHEAATAHHTQCVREELHAGFVDYKSKDRAVVRVFGDLKVRM